MNRQEIIVQLQALREVEYQIDAGDGFQRAHDGQIENIADLFTPLLTEGAVMREALETIAETAHVEMNANMGKSCPICIARSAVSGRRG